MVIKDTIHSVLKDKSVVFADFEMIRRPKGSSNPTSIISAGFVYPNDKAPLHINVAPEKGTPWKLINDTVKFLGISKQDVLSGISFIHFYKRLLKQTRNAVLVVWGDYDELTLASQCARAGIPHTVEIFNLQQAVMHYLKQDIHLSRMLQDSSFQLPLSKLYKALLDDDMKTTHNPVLDALALKEIFTVLTEADKVKSKAIEITLMRLMQTHTMEAFERYMNHRLEIMTKNLAYVIHGTSPEKSDKKKFAHEFTTLNDVMMELQKRVQLIESKQREQCFYFEEENIDLAEFGPVDTNGDPVGW